MFGKGLAAMDNRAIVTVVGKDRVGIIAALSSILAEANANIVDISQTILQEFFTMVMIADLSGCTLDLAELQDRLARKGEELGVKVTVQHEKVFGYMHRV